MAMFGMIGQEAKRKSRRLRDAHAQIGYSRDGVGLFAKATIDEADDNPRALSLVAQDLYTASCLLEFEDDEWTVKEASVGDVEVGDTGPLPALIRAIFATPATPELLAQADELIALASEATAICERNLGVRMFDVAPDPFPPAA